jgi:hypothetical protein
VEVVIEEEGKDTKGRDIDISSNIGGNREDTDNERDMPCNL